MERKWLIRIVIFIIFALMMYYGYQAKKSYEESLKPHIEQYYDGVEPQGFIFDLHGHAYRTADDGMTRYLDDPKLYKDTVIPYRTDYTPPPPKTIKRGDPRPDEFPIKGKVIKDRDDAGSAYTDQEGAYDGILPGDDEVYY